MNMIRYLFFFILLGFAKVAAQQIEARWLRQEVRLAAGLNSYLALEVEPSYSFMFHKNVGIVGGLKCVQEIVDNLRYNLTSSSLYEWRVNGRRKVSALLLRPALRLRYPIVGEDIFITIEPGVLLNLIPNEKLEFAYMNTETIELPHRYEYRRNKGGDVLFYEVKGYFSLYFDHW